MGRGRVNTDLDCSIRKPLTIATIKEGQVLEATKAYWTCLVRSQSAIRIMGYILGEVDLQTMLRITVAFNRFRTFPRVWKVEIFKTGCVLMRIPFWRFAITVGYCLSRESLRKGALSKPFRTDAIFLWAHISSRGMAQDPSWSGKYPPEMSDNLGERNLPYANLNNQT